MIGGISRSGDRDRLSRCRGVAQRAAVGSIASRARSVDLSIPTSNAVLPTWRRARWEITRADAVLIFTYDAAKHQFNLTEAIGIDKSTDRARLAIDPDGSALGDAATSGEPVAIPDLADARRSSAAPTPRSRPGFHAVLVVRWSTSRAFWDRWWCCAKPPANFRKT